VARASRHAATAARPYRPRVAAPRRAIASAAAWAGLGALWAGTMAHALSRLFPPVDVMLPAAIGAAVGGALAMTVRRLRLARPRPVMVIAAASVLLALACQLLFDFRAARAARAAEFDRILDVREMAGLATPAELIEDRAAWMEGWTFIGYASARLGFDDSGKFSGTPPVLGRTGALAVSGVALLLAIGIAAWLAGRAAAEPACPQCGEWRAARPLGSAAHGVSRAVVGRLLAGDAPGAAELLRPPDTREEVLFAAMTCPAGCDGDGGVLRIGEVFWTRGRRLALRRVADLELEGGALGPIADALDDGEA
jgi:hypothetical protein